jgi:16S rRNA processing protein RimM
VKPSSRAGCGQDASGAATESGRGEQHAAARLEPAADSLAGAADWVVMGRVAAPFGVKGWIKVQPFCENPETLMDNAFWRIGRDDAQRSFEVVAVQPHGKALIARLAGVDDREAAFALRGLDIALPRAVLPEPEADTFYWADLLGLAVFNREGVALGHVERLLETGAHDVLVVKGRREHLIPFVAPIVGDVDLETRRIEVDWGEDY